jgi:lactoylglutathione lyase
MDLGTFSISLAVNDLAASREFYEKLGFERLHGSESDRYLVMKNGATLIGLFEGMFEDNILTFNPGWDADGRELESYTDVRELQKELRSRGIEFAEEADETTSGPTSFVVVDPDGNPILVDQHV